MSLAEYNDYITYRNNLNAKTVTASNNLVSAKRDVFAICVTDAIRKNVWFIEVVESSVNKNSVTVKGPCIHLVFDTGACPNANTWIRFFNRWDGESGNSFVNAMTPTLLVSRLRQLNKCEIYGSFNQNISTPGITLNGVFKNNTINPLDDNTVVAMDARNSAKVGAFVTYLTTTNIISTAINGCSFLHGAHETLGIGALSDTQLTDIKGE